MARLSHFFAEIYTFSKDKPLEDTDRLYILYEKPGFWRFKIFEGRGALKAKPCSFLSCYPTINP